jgi:hypothetical protein
LDEVAQERPDRTVLAYGLAPARLSAVVLRRVRKWVGVAAVVISVYAGSYLVLSMNGRYEPAVIGINYVKFYQWAPKGFVDHYRWRRGWIYFYYPLYTDPT